jgi:hypothetical protein
MKMAGSIARRTRHEGPWQCMDTLSVTEALNYVVQEEDKTRWTQLFWSC